MFEGDIDLGSVEEVEAAIADSETNTVVRFVLRTAADAASRPNSVRLVHGTGCSSAVGVRGGWQTISLGTCCDPGRGIHCSWPAFAFRVLRDRPGCPTPSEARRRCR